MGENYVYMDDDEMMELQDMLDDMLSEESFSMNALDGATVYAGSVPGLSAPGIVYTGSGSLLLSDHVG